MSSETQKTDKRPYRKRRRAELEDETRLRITEAAVDLHTSVGPARTTISAVAERAGVQRATVYRHFPDEDALFAACSGHYMALNPTPDPGAWSEIDDPDARFAAALGELYRWYERAEPMLENVTRDLPLVPALEKTMGPMERFYETAAAALLAGRGARGARRRRLVAAIGHALAFTTWRSLVREQGLSREEAIELMLATVAAAGR